MQEVSSSQPPPAPERGGVDGAGAAALLALALSCAAGAGIDSMHNDTSSAG